MPWAPADDPPGCQARIPQTFLENIMQMLSKYKEDAGARQAQGIPALPLSAGQVQELTDFLGKDREVRCQESPELVELLANRVELGVAAAARVKAAWLEKVASGSVTTKTVSPEAAIAMLGNMGGGYNVAALIRLLEQDQVAAQAAQALTTQIGRASCRERV